MISRGVTRVVKSSAITPRSFSPAIDPASTAGPSHQGDRQKHPLDGRQSPAEDIEGQIAGVGRLAQPPEPDDDQQHPIIASAARTRTRINQPRPSARPALGTGQWADENSSQVRHDKVSVNSGARGLAFLHET